MSERQTVPEVSQQYATDLAYFNFVRLAQVYGQDPSRNKDALNPELSPLLNDATRTLRVAIPADSDIQRHFDLISGLDYGTNVVEIFYRKGETAAKVTLKKAEKTGLVKMYTNSVFKVSHTVEDFHTMELEDKTKIKPDIYIITQLLKKAEEILQKEEKDRIASKFDKPKLSVRQKLSGKIGNFFDRE